MARHGGMAQLVVGCFVAAIALGVVTSQPSPSFTDNSPPPPPFTSNPSPGEFTNNSPPPPPFTNGSPPPPPFTNNSPPPPPFTDNSPPPPPFSNASPPPPPFTNNSPPPPPFTNNRPPPPPLSNASPPPPPFTNNSPPPPTDNSSPPPPFSTDNSPPPPPSIFLSPPSFSPTPIDMPPPSPPNMSNPPPPPSTPQPDHNFTKPNLVRDCASGGDANYCIMECPDRCPRTCLFECSSCKVACRCDRYPGVSCGDPSFTGGDGNTFYFHGSEDRHFCIVSDADLHINAHFIGNHNPAIKRNFTWIQGLGISFGNHRLALGARKAMVWDEDEDHLEITIDGEPVSIGAENNAHWMSSRFHDGRRLSVTRLDTVNSITVDLPGVFTISASAVPITDEESRIHSYGKTGKDSLVHLDLRFKFHSLTDDVDGVLGQTYRPDYVNKMDVTVNMPIMGGAPKYLSSDLFSNDCAVSRFHHDGDSTVDRVVKARTGINH